MIQELAGASEGGVAAAAVVQAGANTAWLALPPAIYHPWFAALGTAVTAAVVIAGRSRLDSCRRRDPGALQVYPTARSRYR